MFFDFKKTTIASMLLVTITAPAVFAILPQPAEAYVPIDQKGFSITAITACIIDITSKENCGDMLAWIAAKAALNLLAQLVVEWVRTGNADFSKIFYGGEQTWILNFEQYLQDAANHAAGIFIGELLGPTIQAQLCSPFRIPLTNYFRNRYGFGFPPFPHARCTLTQIISNIQNFQVDFYQGGNEAFLNTWMNPDNNPIGALMTEQRRLESMAARRITDATIESQANQGFIGTKKCVEYFNESTIGGDDIVRCKKYEITTPGKAIQDQLNNALKSQFAGWEHADELSEVLAQFIVSLAGALVERGLKK